MNSFEINFSIKLKYKQYKNLDIFYVYNEKNQYNFLPDIKGFINKKSLENLKKLQFDDLKYYKFLLLNKKEVDYFRRFEFEEAYEKVSIKSEKEIFKTLSNKDYELYYVNKGTAVIMSIDKKEIYPLFINLNEPLYLINNKDFDLKFIQKKISMDNRFVSLFENNKYEDIISNEKNIIISSIPKYNVFNEINQYINVGFIPSKEDWILLMKIIKEKEIKINKNGYIDNLSEVIIESGILGFERERKEILI